MISNTVHCSSQTYKNISFGDELNIALKNLVQMYKVTQEMKVSAMFHIHAICMQQVEQLPCDRKALDSFGRQFVWISHVDMAFIFTCLLSHKKYYPASMQETSLN